jgi:DnaJ-class molecular chaperone
VPDQRKLPLQGAATRRAGVPSPNPDSTGEDVCPTCGGSGFLDAGARCADCRGTGVLVEANSGAE